MSVAFCLVAILIQGHGVGEGHTLGGRLEKFDSKLEPPSLATRGTLAYFDYGMAGEHPQVSGEREVHLPRPGAPNLSARVSVSGQDGESRPSSLPLLNCHALFGYDHDAGKFAARNHRSPVFIGIVWTHVATAEVVVTRCNTILKVDRGMPATTEIETGCEVRQNGLYSYELVVVGRDAADSRLYLLASKHGFVEVK
ncbi:MAG: hypothetical protein DWQ34_14245 [Planctomycetota bacterium]|nr:MAG: hypothetical protein DWQ34_14245 [Planctomycetota bacterium]REK22847.1 MAG: hypothetical protein DWQ41_18815 [Planctomycetota bacterium]REK34013.1 MAG: hypothetical protein DWQ45_14080 [Planctomycetota bacterium]